MKQRIFSIIVIALLFVATTHEVVHALSSDQDTDGDGIPDVSEDANGNGTLDAGETDPYNTDSDGGGEADGSEIRAGRNPLDRTDDLTTDTDGDGWVNGIELIHNTDPKKADTDGDGVNDPEDPFPLDAKYSTDADHNGLPDDWEQSTQLSQQPIPQSKVDDPDGDGLTNAEELAKGTNPVEADSDRDGVDDKTELNDGTNARENACFLYAREDRPFGDMKNHWASNEVSILKSTRILPQKMPLVRGYDVRTGSGISAQFSPDQPITRFEFLKMILLSTCTHFITATDREKRFKDIMNVPFIGENEDMKFRRQVIYSAAHFGVTSGYGDGSFKPNANVNRAEAVKMLILAAQFVPAASSGTTLSFSDVKSTDWFAAYVATAADHEIVRGYPDGTFHPDQPITRAEAAKIIVSAMRQNPLVNGYVLPERE